MKDGLQKGSSVNPSSRPKLLLNLVILRVIFAIPHPAHTFNLEFFPRLGPDPGLEIRPIPNLENLLETLKKGQRQIQTSG